MGRRQMKPNNFRIAHNTQDWWGFTLQRGHAFGLFQPDPGKRGVCYVSGGEPDSRKRYHIVAYRQTAQTKSPNCYRWRPVSVAMDSQLGQLIMGALRSSPYDGVCVAINYQRVNRAWQPMPPNYKTPVCKQDKDGMYCLSGGARVYRKPVESVQHKQGVDSPNFPTFRKHRPETSPQPPKTKDANYMADSVDYHAITVSAETAKIWNDNNAAADEISKQRHKAQWIQNYMLTGSGHDLTKVETLYNKIFA